MLITARDPNLFRARKFATYEEYNSVRRLWENEKKPPYYDGAYGQHIIDLKDYDINVNQKTLINDDGSITINSPVIPEGNHPGNLNSVEEIRFLRNGGIFRIEVSNRGRFKNNKGYARSERVLNKEFKGYAARITYRYNEKYRAEVEPESAADIEARIDAASDAADAKRWKDEAAAERARLKKEAEKDAYDRSPEGIAAREAEFARQDAEEAQDKQDLADYLKTPEGQEDVRKFELENVSPSEEFLESRGR